jgi:hypothetical protein
MGSVEMFLQVRESSLPRFYDMSKALLDESRNIADKKLPRTSRMVNRINSEKSLICSGDFSGALKIF